MSHRDAPLVALACSVPLLDAAVAGSLAGVAKLERLNGRDTELGARLRSLQPDAIVVDRPAAAEAAARYARFARVPVVQLSARDATLRLHAEGRWQELGDATPESIRSLVATL